MSRQLYKLYGLLIFFLILNIGTWLYSRHQHEIWPNVPPPPSAFSLSASFLGDRALAYRSWALFLQNTGNTGGNYEPLKNYDYAALGKWFDVMDTLDPHSNFLPYLVSYYFGATQTPKEQIPYIIPYLEKVGSRPEGTKWFWLAQGIYLARHKLGDMDEALRLSKKLSSLYRPGMPAWTLHTQALLTAETGDKAAALLLMKAMLATEAKNMQGAEINFMVDYICSRILSGDEVQREPLCQLLPDNNGQPAAKD